MSSSRGSSRPRDQTRVFCAGGQFFTPEPWGKPDRRFNQLNHLKTSKWWGRLPLNSLYLLKNRSSKRNSNVINPLPQEFHQPGSNNLYHQGGDYELTPHSNVVTNCHTSQVSKGPLILPQNHSLPWEAYISPPLPQLRWCRCYSNHFTICIYQIIMLLKHPLCCMSITSQ